MNSNPTTLDTLWQALLEDPNDIRQLSLWVEKHQDEQGDQAALGALQRAAKLPTGWLAKIWLTRSLLERGMLCESMRLYQEALHLAPKRSMAVQEIAGHLGEAGYFNESIELLLPMYSPADHGPFAGFNLFNACEDSGNWGAAQEVLDRMKTVDWKKPVNEIVRIRQEKLNLYRQLEEQAKPELN